LLHRKIVHAAGPDEAEQALSALRSIARREDGHLSWLQLAVGLHYAAERLGDLRFAKRCHRALRRAERRAATREELCQARYVRAMAAALHERATGGDGGPLGAALPAAEQALELCPPGFHLYPACVSSLAEVLVWHFEFGGDPEPLERAVALLRSLIDDGSLPETDRADVQGELAMALRLHVELRWDGPLLDEAIEAARAATRRPSPKLHAHLGTLGTLLRIRFDHTGELAALDEAVQVYLEALQCAAPGTHFHRGAANNLGNVLSSRARVTGSQDDRDAAIDLFENLVEITPPGIDQYARVLTNYGNVLVDRIHAGERPGDMRRALTVLEGAVRGTASASPHLARRLFNLANGYQLAFTLSEERDDIDTAVRTYRRALEALPRDSAFRPTYLAALASALMNQVSIGGDDFTEVEATFAEAVREGELTAPGTVLRVAGLLGAGLCASGRWEEAAEHLSTGMRAMARLVRTQHRRGHSEAWLERADGLPAMTAYALAKGGRYAEAVRAIEEGRAMLLSRVLDRDHQDLGALRAAGHPDLADRWDRLTAELAVLEGADVAGHAPPDAQGHALRVRELQRALDELAERITRLLPPDPREPAGSAVYLVPAPWGGVALLLRPGAEPAPVWLDSLVDDAVRDAVIALYREDADAAERERALRDIGGWLWEAALRDVLRELGGLPEVFVSVGLLGLLPLHAARPDGPGESAPRHLIDLGSVPTAPNLQAWRESRRRASDSRTPAAATVLAVGAPVESGAALPYAAEEARMVAAALAAPGAERVGTDARVTDVARLAPSADVLHFACHGAADLMTPLRGGLVLAHGQVLTLSALMRMRIRARLVVLSACDSGLSGTALPDEVVGLPTGLLQAGAAAVVASLWEVPDATALLLMTDFYDRWRSDPAQGTAAALAAAQRWLRDTSNGAKRDRFTRWLETGHPWIPDSVAEACFEAVALRDPLEYDHASPLQWAAFVHVGA
ncbi:CHAT domain-containing protein, partial [Streptomyces sp. KR55]|uniref:CHAT domain-containing protein n=1 Tax=Streptomyces sp. KR55 TaxID=3457425 RepID=UPI003FD22001